MKILIGINTLTAVEQIAYMSHVHFFYRLGKNHPNDDFAINTPRRMSIDRMRNMSAKLAIENNFDYLMFIDDDVIIPTDAFDRLRAADKDIVAGWTLIRGYPYPNMFFRYEDEESKRLIMPTDIKRGSGVIDVDAVGFSCVLIKVDLLKRVPSPWFVTGPFNTEDIYFCVKARQVDPNTSICVDTSIETAHILGPEVIAPWNRDQYMKYYEDSFPELLPTEGPENKPFEHLQDTVLPELTYESVLDQEICK